MVKRLGISFCFVMAFALLQIHSFIPHHHDDEAIEANHHHEHEEDDEDHESPYTDLAHNADFGKVMAKPHFVKELSEKPDFSLGLLFQLNNRLEPFEKPPRPHPPDGNCFLHLIFISHSLPLRAPPSYTC